MSLLSWERGLKYKAKVCVFPEADVAPLVGAWIEIDTDSVKGFDWDMVAPLVGAWIEINCYAQLVISVFVAPLVGAWIEIRKENQRLLMYSGVAPLVGAWIEIDNPMDFVTNVYSRSSRGSVD